MIRIESTKGDTAVASMVAAARWIEEYQPSHVTIVTDGGSVSPDVPPNADARAALLAISAEQVSDGVRVDVDALRELGCRREAQLIENGIDDDTDDETRAKVVAALRGNVDCACGAWSGERCQWSGPRSETVIVEWMPESLRASHVAAGNSGSYPQNGAQRIRVERSCAKRMVEHDGDWARIVD